MYNNVIDVFRKKSLYKNLGLHFSQREIKANFTSTHIHSNIDLNLTYTFKDYSSRTTSCYDIKIMSK